MQHFQEFKRRTSSALRLLLCAKQAAAQALLPLRGCVTGNPWLPSLAASDVLRSLQWNTSLCLGCQIGNRLEYSELAYNCTA